MESLEALASRPGLFNPEPFPGRDAGAAGACKKNNERMNFLAPSRY